MKSTIEKDSKLSEEIKNPLIPIDFRLQKNVFNLLEKLRELQNQFGSTRNSLIGGSVPEIILVGPQSHGKSSVVRRIVEADYFPFESSLCTRCPIRLKLGSAKDGRSSISCKIPGNDQKIQISNLNETSKIKESISQYFETIKKDNKVEIDEKEIIIECYFKECKFEFELVDLPGYQSSSTKVNPSAELLRKYLKKENSIICLINNADVDIKTNEVYIGMIQQEERQDDTIVIFTKMDKIANEKRVEQLKEFGTKFKNCIYLANMPKEDMQRENCILKFGEQKKFENKKLGTPLFSSLNIKKKGISCLKQLLCQEYTKIIAKWLPEYKQTMIVNENQIWQNIQSLGTVIPDNETEKARMLQEYVDKFKDKIVRIGFNTNEFKASQLKQISENLFNEIKAITVKDGEWLEEKIKKDTGSETGTSHNNVQIKYYIEDTIKQIRKITFDFGGSYFFLVKEIVKNFVDDCIPFPTFAEIFFLEYCNDCLCSAKYEMDKFLDRYIAIEHRNVLFFDSEENKNSDDNLSSVYENYVNYFKNVINTTSHSIPKIIRDYLVANPKIWKKIQPESFQKFLNNFKDDNADQREILKKNLKFTSDCIDIIKKLEDTSLGDFTKQYKFSRREKFERYKIQRNYDGDETKRNYDGRKMKCISFETLDRNCMISKSKTLDRKKIRKPKITNNSNSFDGDGVYGLLSSPCPIQ